ncbi:MAG TPA: urea carboxylase, partial [Acidimicrobiales bacterium]|nr:urea carboxylase [Acidimicrobiales bacterium]
LGLATVAVFSDPDRGAPHVRMADRAVRLGPAAARESYLRADAIIEAAVATGAGAIHPGYGFLSEDAAFARAVEDAGLVFVGPTPAQMELFGVKHTARVAAATSQVPLLGGSGLLADIHEASVAAGEVGYPVMIKATGGGGGIGILPCRDPEGLAAAFETVTRLSGAGFRTPGVFIERLVERARHLEVQIVGDGEGDLVVLGDRDCSLQRRNQKVVEEAPAPNLPDGVRSSMAESSARLARSVSYRSVGTVEFIYDPEREEVAFLEVNTRLQVEHPVTEEVWGVDLVAAMLRLADGDPGVLGQLRAARPAGHAVEGRIYAEDAAKGHQPSAGLVTGVAYPAGVRVDGWVEAGTEVTPAYDPLLAKVVACGGTRDEALDRLAEAIGNTHIGGIETNTGFVRAALLDPSVRAATHTTGTLEQVADPVSRIDVLRSGTQTTVQDWPGRLGFWHIGVPPSGPMDDLSFRLGNLAVGNPEGAPGIEVTLEGPALRFATRTMVCVTGAPSDLRIDGDPVAMWEPVVVPAGATLDIGSVGAPGIRAYVLVAGGIDVPEYLGSAATFILGVFGGHGGRALRPGDVLHPVTGLTVGAERVPIPMAKRPEIARSWELSVLPGPHGDGEFFTDADLDGLYSVEWEVHFNSARTGIRLLGPRPTWARTDGGDAGMHPSNIHDTPYSLGAVNYTGDLPILLGPDGPSLGGFVCPATVVSWQRWKLGQLRPGDRVQFVPDDATPRRRPGRGDDRSGILTRSTAGGGPEVTYRSNGDDNLLVEYGPMVLDLGLRARVHGLAEQIEAAGIEGVLELTPGVRGLQVHVDVRVTSVDAVLDQVGDIEGRLPPTEQLEVPSREVHLPLSWDDPTTRESIARYMAGVRDDAPWCPSNIEFIRRVNGLDEVEEVSRIVHDATYLVLGLGDVYLGAPLATPIDPRHRLVTTKYNPARTWTAENSVGIGGSYLCIYGMEGPGGYQLVGRTVQIWGRFLQRAPYEPGAPWLLRFFDRIRWYPVSAEELLDARADMAAGRLDLRIEPGTFRLGEYEQMLRANAGSIAEFRARQAGAFAAERDAWKQAGELDPRDDLAPAIVASEVAIPSGGSAVVSPMTASVWKIEVRPGDTVEDGQVLGVLEAMKTEMFVTAPAAGVVVDILVTPGDQVAAGHSLFVLGPAA